MANYFKFLNSNLGQQRVVPWCFPVVLAGCSTLKSRSARRACLKALATRNLVKRGGDFPKLRSTFMGSLSYILGFVLGFPFICGQYQVRSCLHSQCQRGFLHLPMLLIPTKSVAGGTHALSPRATAMLKRCAQLGSWHIPPWTWQQN